MNFFHVFICSQQPEASAVYVLICEKKLSPTETFVQVPHRSAS